MTAKLAMNRGTFSLESGDLLMMVQAISRAKFTGVNFRDNHIGEYVKKDHSIQEIKNLLKE
jgi:hypothetical protein